MAKLVSHCKFLNKYTVNNDRIFLIRCFLQQLHQHWKGVYKITKWRQKLSVRKAIQSRTIELSENILRGRWIKVHAKCRNGGLLQVWNLKDFWGWESKTNGMGKQSDKGLHEGRKRSKHPHDSSVNQIFHGKLLQ